MIIVHSTVFFRYKEAPYTGVPMSVIPISYESILLFIGKVSLCNNNFTVLAE